MARITREKYKTRGGVFDAFTERNLFYLSSKGLFEEETLSPIKIGKEANIFSAKRPKSEERLVIKIYRLETCDFDKMFDYLVVDPRFAQLKNQKRKVIFAWARREYSNLLKARNAGMNVPTPYDFKDNILFMEYIEDEGQPALQLKDTHFTKTDYKKMLSKIIKQLRIMHNEAGLSHGDLSKFNILIKGDEPYFIDFSQAVPIESPNSRALLERDCKNIADYFQKQGLEVEAEDILKKVLE